MIVSLFTPFVDDENIPRRDFKDTAPKYLRGWFLIDFLSIFPFDALPSASSNVRVMRLLKLLRLFKLLRVLKSMRIINKYIDRVSFSYSTYELVSMMVGCVVMAHWTACAWQMSTTFEDGPIDWVRAHGFETVPAAEKYLAAMHLSVMTVTTIGYGDIVPKTIIERIVSIFTMFVGASVYGYVLGAISGIAASMNVAGNDFKRAMDNLNAWMEDVQCQKDLRVRLRQYFIDSKATHKRKYHNAVLEAMSPGLQARCLQYIHAGNLTRESFLNDRRVLSMGPCWTR